MANNKHEVDAEPNFVRKQVEEALKDSGRYGGAFSRRESNDEYLVTNKTRDFKIYVSGKEAPDGSTTSVVDTRNFMGELPQSIKQMVGGGTSTSRSYGSEKKKKSASRKRSGRSNETRRGASSSQQSRDTDAVVETFDDGSVRFMPRFTKEEADYTDRAESRDITVHCEECANYIEGGGCHLVQGPIEPKGFCEEFYSDYVFFVGVELDIWVRLTKKGELVRGDQDEELAESMGDAISAVMSGRRKPIE